jgi:hypothetical protein
MLLVVNHKTKISNSIQLKCAPFFVVDRVRCFLQDCFTSSGISNTGMIVMQKLFFLIEFSLGGAVTLFRV